jgi:hypothetical protein
MDQNTDTPEVQDDDFDGRPDSYACVTCGIAFEAYSEADAAERHDSGEIEDYDHDFVLAKNPFHL